MGLFMPAIFVLFITAIVYYWRYGGELLNLPFKSNEIKKMTITDRYDNQRKDIEVKPEHFEVICAALSKLRGRRHNVQDARSDIWVNVYTDSTQNASHEIAIFLDHGLVYLGDDLGAREESMTGDDPLCYRLSDDLKRLLLVEH